MKDFFQRIWGSTVGNMRSVDGRKAAEIAKNYLADITNVPMNLISVEEIVRTRDGDAWSVTLGYPGGSALGMTSVLPGKKPMEFKELIVMAKSGEVSAMLKKPMD